MLFGVQTFKHSDEPGTQESELDGRAILIGGQTSDTHVTVKLEPRQSYFYETVTN